jgi:hypothetical protein
MYHHTLDGNKLDMEQTEKTGYEWSLEANIRLLNLGEYENYEGEYFTGKITAKGFYERLENCTVKPNSQPRKTDMYLEYRMYGLVPYNLSPIQQGIQFGHAVVDYEREFDHQSDRGTHIDNVEKIYNKWADEDKTFIILNGGTTNTSPNKLGALNKHYHALLATGVRVQPFYEPDLGDQLTAICFLVDERVFNRELYPDFIEEKLPWGRKKPSEKELSELDVRNEKNRERWVEKIGGTSNAWLREYLKPLRLA